jgi:pimeloyl-ACP methyl ester carboxylesterase
MYLEEHGPVDGAPIVFLHGSMVAGWMWLGQVDGLPDHRCLLPDLPGIGRSADEPWVSFADAAGHPLPSRPRSRWVTNSRPHTRSLPRPRDW